MEAKPGTDEAFMGRALELAEGGMGLASPNPMVGAVLVREGRVVGEGWHEGPGTPHAEAMALGRAGDAARGATLYVTLEPCSHHGRTPPCAPAVASAGVVRVVAAVRDPNPLVDGRGFGHLREAGVKVVEGVLSEEGADLVAGFSKHVRTGLPFVSVKLAASLDGRVAARDGSSRWITGLAARQDVHRQRGRSGAIAVGSGTVASDDPSLTVRLEGYRGRPPIRVVVDGRGTTREGARVFDGAAPALVATTVAGALTSRARWEARGAEVVAFDPTERGRVPLGELASFLGKRDLQAVLIEGGPTLAAAAVEEGVVDRLVLYLAPKLIGGAAAPGILGGDGVRTVEEALRVRVMSVQTMGEDLRIVAEPA